MNLITLEDEMPVFNPEVRLVKEFHKLLKRDKGSKGDHDGRKKLKATRELSFIYFYCVYDSRFEAYDGQEKIDMIKELVELPDDWKIDEDVQAAIDKYTFLIETPSMGLFKQAQKQINNLDNFFEDLDLWSDDNRTKSDGLIIKPKDVADMVERIPKLVRSLIEAQNLIEKELDEKQEGKSQDLSFQDKMGTNKDIQDGY